VVVGEFNANGVLGLAPSEGDQNIVNSLQKSGEIDKKIVMFNFENP